MSAGVPRVSVVVPVYNSGRYLGDTLRSVLEQTDGDFELVVTDNASTDDSLEVVAGFDDSRIRVLRNERDLGAVPNFIRGVAAARGRFVKLLGSDDLLYPTCLERQAAILDDPANAGIVLVTAPHHVIDENGLRITTRGFRRAARMDGRDVMRRLARSGTNLVGEPSAVLFRADAYAKAGPWSAEARYVVDLDLWMRFLAAGDLVVLPETLSAYRVHGSAWSARVAHNQTDDMRALLERLAADAACPITRGDARLGSVRASVNTRLRHLFYRVFARETRRAPAAD